MSETRAQALAVAYDAAEEADDYDDALRERVAASLRRMRIATAWRMGQRHDAATGRELARVEWTPRWAILGGRTWTGRVYTPDGADEWRESRAYESERAAQAWCDATLCLDGWVLVPEEGA